MFTGIVEHIGTVSEYISKDDSESGGQGASITITDVGPILDDVHLGDSIAINGTCLTVTEFNGKEWFKVGLSPETLNRTNLGDLKKNDIVNLERAIAGDVRFGGHMVQGHIDTTAKIVDIKPEGNALNFTFKLTNDHYNRYIVEKGFICTDGVSLTVTEVNSIEKTFSISMIAYTQTRVIISKKKIGDLVNVEVDLTGKLLEKQVELQISKQIINDDSPLSKYINNIVDKKINAIINSKK